ncbi:hypothetical protein SK128_000887 [Halocaridina rubra]|uniref:VWFD domain-containing protein n=1 Tax=Halocaridina rubra TaxID=373956 RepID=A0AAN8X334_HALRR
MKSFLLLAISMVYMRHEDVEAQSIETFSSGELSIGNSYLRTLEEILGVLPKRCKSCCYGGRRYRHGKVVDTFPRKCLHLYCYLGRIKPYYHGGENECGCCMFNGTMYLNGQSVPDICVRITCQDGQWVSSGLINSNCKLCQVWNDPFFVTFDSYFYQWHGKCNYSISQKHYGLSESFGIYGQFTTCPWTSSQSCLEFTTFTDSSGAVVQIDHLTSGLPVTINSVLQTLTTTIQTFPSSNQFFNILAWKWGNCYIFVGTQGFVMKACRDKLFVWAKLVLSGQVNGLCGHYNLDQVDDFTDRWGNMWPLSGTPFAFPNSWKTTSQPSRCPVASGRRRRSSDPENAEDPCQADQPELDNIRAACETLLTGVQWNGFTPSVDSFEYAVSSCVATVCTMNQNGTSQEVVDEWKGRMQVMLETTVENEAVTVDFDTLDNTTTTSSIPETSTMLLA